MSTPSHLPIRVELHQRLYVQSRAQQLMWGSLVLITLVAVAALALFLFKAGHVSRNPEALLNAVLARLARNPLDAVIHVVMLIAVILHLYYLRRAQQHERLILTPAGIEYHSPMPPALQALKPSWSLAWSRIRSAALKSMLPGGGPQTVVLELDGGARKVKLFPHQWVDPAHHRPASLWQEMRKLRKLQRITPLEVGLAIQETPILRYLAAALPHLAPRGDATLASATFALEKNRRSLAIVIAFFALVAYALGDAILGSETYVEAAPYEKFATLGTLAAFAAAVWLWRGKVPAAESILVALLFGGALGAAGYPGALRINALSDAGGLRAYEYRLTRDRQLEPLTPGLPTLAFPRYYDYWEQFEPGSHHTFELRKGGLGFYQINMQPVNAALRELYTSR